MPYEALFTPAAYMAPEGLSLTLQLVVGVLGGVVVLILLYGRRILSLLGLGRGRSTKRPSEPLSDESARRSSEE